MQETLSAEARAIIRANPLFANLTPEQMDDLLSIMYEEKVSVGVNVVQEGEPGDTVYIVRKGRVEVLKEDDNGEYHHISMLKPGDVIGEISLIDSRPRSATVRAVEDTSLIGLNVEELYKHSKPEVSLASILKVNFAKTLSQNIRKLNIRSVAKLKDQIKRSQKQVFLGQYIFSLMILVCLYLLSMSIFNAVISLEPDTAYLSVPVIFLFALAFYQLINRSDFTKRTFGLTLEGWRYSVFDSLLLSVSVMVPVILLAKILYILFIPGMEAVPLFFYDGILAALDEKQRLLLIIAFFFYAISIEFIARGVAQTSFMMFLSHKDRRWQAILLAALFFSLSHAHISVMLAVAVFSLSLFWGWLYSRHSTLIGVILSHLLLGYFGLFIVGFDF
jgi:hypothetical protein